MANSNTDGLEQDSEAIAPPSPDANGTELAKTVVLATEANNDLEKVAQASTVEEARPPETVGLADIPPAKDTSTLVNPGVSQTVAMATEIALVSIPRVASQNAETRAKTSGHSHIRLRLDRNTLAVVNTDQAQEVMVIPQQRLTVMPNMPPAVMGLLNHRSRIFWVLDLPQLSGLSPLEPRATEYHLAILRVQNKSVGLAVQEVQGVTRFSTDLIQSTLDQDISPGLIPYLKGCVQQAGEMLMVLDSETISSYSGYPI